MSIGRSKYSVLKKNLLWSSYEFSSQCSQRARPRGPSKSGMLLPQPQLLSSCVHCAGGFVFVYMAQVRTDLIKKASKMYLSPLILALYFALVMNYCIDYVLSGHSRPLKYRALFVLLFPGEDKHLTAKV